MNVRIKLNRWNQEKTAQLDNTSNLPIPKHGRFLIWLIK